MRIYSGLAGFLVFFFSISNGIGQENYVPPKVSEKYEKELEDAILSARIGRTDSAIETIRDIIKRYPTWTKPRQELSRIYYSINNKDAAIQELEASVAIDTPSQLMQLFTLGRLYEETNDPHKAMASYTEVIERSTPQEDIYNRATESRDNLEKKIKLWEETYNITLIPFPAEINTSYHEALGRWTLDGRQLIFTRLLNDQEDIFIARWDSVDHIWEIFDFPFNTPQGEGAQAISPDGKYLVFTACNRRDGLGGCDLYLSVMKNNEWTAPVNMGGGFNSPSWESQPCFGLDGLSLYFTSNRPGGLGGNDIWYVHQISPGRWSKPINAGPVINTTNNEESPFIHFDGQTLYFMRNGKEGLGGYDLYISRRALDGKWQEPENMKAPINSGANEGALSLHPKGNWAVITRETEDQRNDLFEFELPEKFRAASLQALHVTIKDQKTHKPVHARLEIFEVDHFDTVRLSQWSDVEGKIFVTLGRDRNYGLIAEADGYLLHSNNLEKDTNGIRKLDIEMIPVAASVEEVIVLENIFFETGSAALLSSSEPELNKLLWTLRNNANMKIEIWGHTDDVGEEGYNQQLSEARAKSVYDYLLERGIETSRLTYKGFGESKPKTDNTSPEGRKQNRRTEFLITQI